MNNHLKREEFAFLPAVLEIKEAPPLLASRVFLWSIVIFFILVVAWSVWSEVDIIATAQGKIIPSGRVKTIQPLETGVVKNIFVEEGQLVKEGDLLLELDTTTSTADVEHLKAEKVAATLDELRLNALISSIKKDALQPLQEARTVDALELQIQLQKARLEKQFAEYQNRLATLDSELQKNQAEKIGTQARIAQLQATIPLITERASALKKMEEKQLGPREKWLELEQTRLEQTHELEVQSQRQKALNATISGLQQQRHLLKSQNEAQYLAELIEIRRKFDTTEKELVKAEQRKVFQNLKAPVTGRVQQLMIHTVGGVVTPAQQLMIIVPESYQLEVEAWIANKDIGFIEVGQHTTIKVETFPFTKYGTIAAKVVSLAQDAVKIENIGFIYPARVMLLENQIQVEHRRVNLSPGMAVMAEIKTGKQSVIQYFLSPLLRYKDESIRER